MSILVLRFFYLNRGGFSKSLLFALYCLSAFLIFLTPNVTFSQDSNTSINLTDTEIKWISEHPVIRTANENNWAPIDFARNGRPDGFSIDYINLLASKVGLNIEFVNGYSWEELMEMLKNKEIDLTHGLDQTPEREEYLNFSPTYATLIDAFYGRAGSDIITNIDDLKGKTIGVIRDSTIEQMYRENYPEYIIRSFPNDTEILISLSTGTIDITSQIIPLANYIIEQNSLKGIITVGRNTFQDVSYNNELKMAARSDWPELISILTKAMNAVSEDEYKALTDKWKIYETAASPLDLTIEEIEWLSNQSTIKVGIDPTLAPFEFIDDNGNISGISGDYLKLISENLNINFDWAGNENWDQAIEMSKTGQLHILANAAVTPERLSFLNFTDYYISEPKVIFIRRGGPVYGDISALNDEKVAQIKNFSDTEYIKTNFPEIDIVEVGSITEALKLVSTGQAEAYIGDIPAGVQTISKEGLTNIIISGEAPFRGNSAIAIRSDLPILTSIMRKAILSIPQEQKDEIRRRWLSSPIDVVQDYSLVWKIASGFITIVVIILIWVNSLKREVSRRREVERELRISRKEAEDAKIKAENAKEIAEQAHFESEQANHAKSVFLANMSHEIRTPLNAIIGFSEIMTSGLLGEIKHKKYLEYLMDIKNSGTHLSTVINDILDLSKIEAGKWQLSITQFDIIKCLQDSEKMFGVMLKDKNVKYTNNFDQHPNPLRITADEHSIKRVIINLISNAIKYTYKSGNVSCNINVSENKFVIIKITDDGIGIPKEKMELVLS